MNQKSRQNAKNQVKKGFSSYLAMQILVMTVRIIQIIAHLNLYVMKLMKFCKLKKNCNLFDKDISNFVNSKLIEKEIEKSFNEQECIDWTDKL